MPRMSEVTGQICDANNIIELASTVRLRSDREADKMMQELCSGMCLPLGLFRWLLPRADGRDWGGKLMILEESGHQRCPVVKVGLVSVIEFWVEPRDTYPTETLDGAVVSMVNPFTAMLAAPSLRKLP